MTRKLKYGRVRYRLGGNSVDMEHLRLSDGWLDLDSFAPVTSTKQFVFDYQQNKYYFKRIKNWYSCYHELLAEELAKDYGIPCVHYDLAVVHNFMGFVSEHAFHDGAKVVSLDDILARAYPFLSWNERRVYNNFEDVGKAFSIYYHNPQVEQELMRQFTNIFFFDIFIANIDRHEKNLFVEERDGNVSFARLLDNELMLDEFCLSYGVYRIGIDHQDAQSLMNPFVIPEGENFLEKYLRNCTMEDYQLFLDKLWIISEENVQSALERVSKRIHAPLQSTIEKEILIGFRRNRQMIEQVLQKTKKVYQKGGKIDE